MKKLILLSATLFLTMVAFSQARIPEEILKMKGKTGFLSPSSVTVSLNWNNTVVTTFLQDLPEVTVTVTKKDGEVVSDQTLNAREYDYVAIPIPEYERGNYNIKIKSVEGSLEGEF